METNDETFIIFNKLLIINLKFKTKKKENVITIEKSYSS